MTTSPIQLAREALEDAHRELNAIRARDGVPWTHGGYKSDVSEEYFSSVVDKCRAALAALSAEPEDGDADVGFLCGLARVNQLDTVRRAVVVNFSPKNVDERLRSIADRLSQLQSDNQRQQLEIERYRAVLRQVVIDCAPEWISDVAADALEP